MYGNTLYGSGNVVVMCWYDSRGGAWPMGDVMSGVMVMVVVVMVVV